MKQNSLLNVQHPPDSPTLCNLICNLAGKTFGAAVGGFKVLVLLEASQEVVEASDCKEDSEGKKVQRKPIILCIRQSLVELAVKSSDITTFIKAKSVLTHFFSLGYRKRFNSG